MTSSLSKVVKLKKKQASNLLAGVGALRLQKVGDFYSVSCLQPLQIPGSADSRRQQSTSERSRPDQRHPSQPPRGVQHRRKGRRPGPAERAHHRQ